MSPEKQRIAIAEVCGWEKFSEDEDFALYYNAVASLNVRYPDKEGYNQLPDYLNDLNAMQQAEKILMWQQRDTMQDYLRDGRGGYFATAAQRAEAFLRTIGKWEESI